MTNNYGKKTIWLDPDDVMEYGTDPEIVRRNKILDTSNTSYQPGTRFRSLAEGLNPIFATLTNIEAEPYLKVRN